MPSPSSQHNASYWLRVKHDEARLAHYRARRARNQKARRARLSAAIPQPSPSDAEVLAMVIESLMQAEPLG
jgi:hypothetical protein